MARKIKLSIKARGETDSPRVEDFLDQLRDYFEILEGVEQAIAEDGTNAIEWRVVGAMTNSPIGIEFEAYSKEFAVDVGRRAEIVAKQTAVGLQQLRHRRERPAFFSDKVLELLEPPDKPYDEWGSIEGAARGIDRDARGHLILWVYHRLTGDVVKCFVSGEATEELADHKIRDVWRNRRVLVYGKVHYKGLGKLTQVEAIRMRFLRDRSELPDIDDILDENFTGGMRSEDYLAKLRDGDLN